MKGHPGVRPNALTRQFPVPDNAHRYACRDFTSKGGNDSCDEYPFASTYQSAITAGRDKATWDHVPGPQNFKVGSDLSNFYNMQRIFDKDKFFVEIVD